MVLDLQYYRNFHQRHAAKELEWSQEKEDVLLEPYAYLHAKPGKDMRKIMIDGFNEWFRIPEEKIIIITQTVEMLHNASLLYVLVVRQWTDVYRIDDVEDSATLRRGFPVAHSVYGVPQTINCANYVYFKALKNLASLSHDQEYTEVFYDELLNLHRGQGLDVWWRDTLTCPSELEYIDMVQNKTGGLLRLAVRIMQLCSGSAVSYVPLVNTIGTLFQIRDDYANLQSEVYSHNKGFCEDFTEGKFSFPIIHSIRADVSDRQLLNILKQHTTDVQLKQYAVHYMREQTLSFDYTKQVLNELESSALDEIKRLGGNGKLEAFVKGLHI